MVRGAVAAETAAAVAHGGVWKQNPYTVIVAWYRHRRHLRKRKSSWTKQLRDVYRIVVAERVCVGLAASDQNVTVGEDDAVGKGARIGHVAYCCDVWGVACGAKSDYMGIGGGIGVLVVRCAAYCEDDAKDGVIHGCVAGLDGFVSIEKTFGGKDGAGGR